MLIEKIISGGQTGADQAGLEAAKESGISTGGQAPLNYITEKGEAPWLKDKFGLIESGSANYVPRTFYNVKISDATLWFGHTTSPGFVATQVAADKHKKPFLPIKEDTTPGFIYNFLVNNFKDKKVTLNIAGNRESRNPEIKSFTKTFLKSLFLMQK